MVAAHSMPRHLVKIGRNRKMDRARLVKCLFAVGFSASVASTAHAQAWNQPTFQPPRVVNREFNFAVFTGGDGGTGLVAQWREGIAPDWQLELEAGFASPDVGQ